MQLADDFRIFSSGHLFNNTVNNLQSKLTDFKFIYKDLGFAFNQAKSTVIYTTVIQGKQLMPNLKSHLSANMAYITFVSSKQEYAITSLADMGSANQKCLQ